MDKTVRIGAGSAFFSDSRTGLPQLLRSGGRLDYIVFDHLSEGTMPLLARAQPNGPGYDQGLSFPAAAGASAGRSG